MRYIALWGAIFTGTVIVAGGAALIVYAVINLQAWWVVACVAVAALLATLLVALEYLTDNREDETPT